jgi:hypothetical protein
MALSISIKSHYDECHYAECRIFYSYAERCYAECSYAECLYAECHGTLHTLQNGSFHRDHSLHTERAWVR